MFNVTSQDGQKMIKGLVSIQQAYALSLTSDMKIDQEIALKRINNRIPVIKNEGIFKVEDFKKMLKNISDLIISYQSDTKEQLLILKNNGDRLFEILFGSGQGQGELLIGWAAEQKIPGQLLAIITDWTVRPWKMALGMIVQPLLDSVNWDEGYCPVCGESAELGLITKENGQRLLGCTSCNLTWAYPRIKCPDCGCTDHQAMKYFYIEDVQSQQIHYCEQCDGYLKIIDQRYQTQMLQDLLELSLLTSHLDILAEGKGLRLKEGIVAC